MLYVSELKVVADGEKFYIRKSLYYSRVRVDDWKYLWGNWLLSNQGISFIVFTLIGATLKSIVMTIHNYIFTKKILSSIKESTNNREKSYRKKKDQESCMGR